MASILAAVRRIKRGVGSLLDDAAIERCFAGCGHVWRDRMLGPVTTAKLFLQQIAHGNVSCQAVRHLAEADGPAFTASAYCLARQRLPMEALEKLLPVTAQVAARFDGPAARWRGHVVKLVDGSSFSMSDEPALQDHFGQPGGQEKGCGFPVAHILASFEWKLGLLTDIHAAPLRTHDLAQVTKLHEHLRDGDVVLGDTAFGSYAHFALLLQRKAHGLFPNHQKRIVNFTPRRPHADPRRKIGEDDAGLPRSRWIGALGKDDQIVEWFKPPEGPSWLTQEQYDALPESIVVRELRRTVTRADGRRVTVTLVTTLLDDKQYPASELVSLNERRWDVETNLRHLKITLGMDVLRCQSVDGVHKEMLMFAVVYNLVRIVMLEAARRQDAPPHRISFKDALTWLRHADAPAPLPALTLNPWRPGRLEPRVRKRRPKQFPPMQRPRAELRKALVSQRNID
jgi:hypothetical protein